jgi:tetratricopeptide (TPR) repeat protein
MAGWFVAGLMLAADRPVVLQQAASSIAKGDLAGADAALRGLLSTSPDDAIGLNLLGVVRARQGDNEVAEKLFREAKTVEPRLAGPHINLARLLANEKPAEAVSELGEALQSFPQNHEARELLRSVAKQATELSDAANGKAIVRQALSILPDNSELLYFSGVLAFRTGEYGQAEETLSRALAGQPDYSSARYMLARVYLEQNKAEAAEKEMRSYLAANPKDASAEYGLGYILAAEQKLAEAKDAFARSVELQPKQSESPFQLGEIAEQEGLLDQAKAYYSQALANDGRHAGALAGLGVLAYRTGDYIEAKAKLEGAIALSANYQKAHYYYALTLSKLGYKQQAGQQFEIAKSLQKPHGATALPGAVEK